MKETDRTVVLGNVYDNRKYKNSSDFGGAVIDKNSLSPTLKTGASAAQKFIVEVRKIERNDKSTEHTG